MGRSGAEVVDEEDKGGHEKKDGCGSEVATEFAQVLKLFGGAPPGVGLFPNSVVVPAEALELDVFMVGEFLRIVGYAN